MARKSYEELELLRKKFKTDRLWSWSRINSVHNSLYEYYLKYILHEKEDRADSIYSNTGGLSHDVLEEFYKEEISFDKMIEHFEDGWLVAFNIADLKFDRNNCDKNENIADKYYYDLQHFFKNHNVINHKIDIERFITVKVGDEYYQGYIDAVYKDDNENFVILDWKSSSIYKGAKALNECGQLVMYSMALHQLGVPYEKIKICWNFLKYQNITVSLKNGTTKVREIERCKIGESLQANAKMWLKELGYEEESDIYLTNLLETNDITCLPDLVQEKYVCEDCYVYVELTPELISEWEDFIIKTTKEIREKEVQYELSVGTDKNKHDDSIWCESQESVKGNSFYYATLMAYSPNKHKPYKKFLEESELNKDNNLIGSKQPGANDDMSWLNSI